MAEVTAVPKMTVVAEVTDVLEITAVPEIVPEEWQVAVEWERQRVCEFVETIHNVSNSSYKIRFVNSHF